METHLRRMLMVGWAILLAGCALAPGQSTPTLSPGVIYTAAAQTVAAVLTQSAPPATPTPLASPTPLLPSPMPSGSPAETPTLPVMTPAPTDNTPSPTQTETPCHQAAFVADVTIPDGTLMMPGERFVKTWRLRNTGSCAWTPDYSLVFDHGVLMGGPREVPLDETVRPGETVEVSVELFAPQEAGVYQGFWRLRSPSGGTFGVGPAGDPFWVSIVVVAPTATTTPTP